MSSTSATKALRPLVVASLDELVCHCRRDDSVPANGQKTLAYAPGNLADCGVEVRLRSAQLRSRLAQFSTQVNNSYSRNRISSALALREPAGEKPRNSQI